jgi:beta-propeller repeat-containing protein
LAKPAASRGWTLAFCMVPILAVIFLAVTLVVTPASHRGNAGALPATSFESQPRIVKPGAVKPAARSRIQASYAALPLAFEQNQGQTDSQVKYLARGDGYTLFLTANDAVFSLHSPLNSRDRSPVGRSALPKAKMFSGKRSTHNDSSAVVRMQLSGTNSLTNVEASGKLSGSANYFIGNDPRKWRKNVPRYARVSYHDVYPGVNMAFHGAQRQLEFDFVVAPGADPQPIGFHFTGARSMKTDESGNLVVSSTAGDVLLHRPVAYQQQNGAQQMVDARFVLKADNQVSFELGKYDRSRELVIDPSVSYGYSTYLGGSLEDDGFAIALDSSGDAYVTGETDSLDFAGASRGSSGIFNVFVTELNPGGSATIYTSYIGGTGADSGNGIAVDANNNVYVDGGTSSPTRTFPTTTGAYQTTLNGSANAFLVKLDSTGALKYGTYLGGTGSDTALGLALDGSGNAYLAGKTSSSDFPSKNPPTGAITAGGFLTKLNPGGNGASDLVFSTFIGGGSTDFAAGVALDSSASPAITYVTGQTAGSLPGSSLNTFSGGLEDAFVVAVKSDGSAYVFSRYVGGSNIDIGDGIAADSSGAYVTGETASSTTFPISSSPAQKNFGGGTFDAFATKLSPAGAVVYSTFLGGNADDVGVAIAIDGSGNAYVTGQTASSNFPTQSPTQTGFGGGTSDAFVTELNAAGSQFIFSTYLGGSGNEDTVGNFGGIAADSAGANIYVTGNTTSMDFPNTAKFFEPTYRGGATDAFVVKYAQVAAQTFSLTATALSPATVSPGGSATSTVTVSPTNGFTGSVTLTCSISPAITLGPTCGTASATPATAATLTVSTTAATALLRHSPGRHSSGLFYAMFLPVVGISLMGAGFVLNRSGHNKLFAILMMGAIVGALALLPACGGGGGSKSGGSPGTPAGKYTITVSGTATGATQTGTSPALTLIVN